MGRHGIYNQVKGFPDAIRCSASSEQLLNEGEATQILATVEIKTNQLMSNLLDKELDLHKAIDATKIQNNLYKSKLIYKLKLIICTFGI